MKTKMKHIVDSDKSIQLREYWDTIAPSSVQRLYKYDRRGADATLSRLQAETGIIMDTLVRKVLEEQGFTFNPERDNKSRYNPEMVYDALSRFQEASMKDANTVLLTDAISITRKIFGRKGDKFLHVLKMDKRLKENLKLVKSSGAPHFTSKRDCFDNDLVRAENILQGKTAPPPCVAYRRVQHGENGPKGRLVWGYPQSMTIIESRFARPLIEHFLSNRSPMAFGLHKMSLNARVSEIQDGGVTYSIDYSKYDSTLNRTLINAAFGIVATHFEFSVEEKEAWNVVKRFFVNTLILMPDGFVYRKTSGIPSGSYLTQIIGSICNCIISQYISLRLTGLPINARLINVLGDDGLFRMNRWVELSEVAEIAKELGVTVNPDKSSRVRSKEVPHFLGFQWTRGMPYRPAADLAKRMVFPEMPSKKIDYHDRRNAALTRIATYLGNGPEAWKIFIGSSLIATTSYVPGSLSSFKVHGELTPQGLNAIKDSVCGYEKQSFDKLFFLGNLV